MIHSLLPIFLAVSAAVSPAAELPLTHGEIAHDLANLHDYHGRAIYSVLLPQAEDPIVYQIEMNSTATDGSDPLSPINYLIDWQLGDSKGFSAYYPGHHYRYRNNRLQEYHYDWDSIPFILGKDGVQLQAQFVDILPQSVGRQLEALFDDSAFSYTFTPDTIYHGTHVAALKGKLSYHGYVSRELTYIFDPDDGMVRTIEMENNPGQISEQSITINYTDSDSEPFAFTSEDNLIERYPEVFERFRQSNFKVENLPGTPLPTFSAPTSTGERYTYHRGDPFRAPTIILMLNDEIGSAKDAVDAVRNAADRSAASFDLIFAFTSNNADRAEAIVGELHPGEHLLLGARGLARDCGVTVCPTLIYVGRDGRIADVTLGYNKELSSIVIQKIALM